LLNELSAAQFAEWIAYYNLEPWGPQQEDFRAGQICASIANYAGKARNEKSGLASAAEFFPSLLEKPEDLGKPVLVADAKAQSDLIREKLFKKEL
jgi:hypothetical protein